MTPTWTEQPHSRELVARVGCVDAVVSLAHRGRPRGPWHAGAFRASRDEDGVRDGPAVYATTTDETWASVEVAKEVAVRKARELDAWLRKIVAETEGPS